MKRLTRDRRPPFHARLVAAGAVVALALVATTTWVLVRGSSETAGHHVATLVSSVPKRAPLAVRRCQQLVAPHSSYTRVLVAREASGSQVKDWLISRDSGIFSPTQLRELADNATYVVCGMAATDLSPPGPAPVSGAAAWQPPTAVSVVLVPDQTPVTDAMGDPARVKALVAELHH